MGYYTSYELNVVGVGDTSEIIQQLREYSEDCTWAFDGDGNTEEPCKGYDIDEDITKFSKTHPDMLFVLKGEGEESGDIWITYYKDGKDYSEKANISFPDFDSSKFR